MNHETAIFHSFEVIENCISEKLSVGNIAKSVHFSPYHYGRLFRAIVGETVMDYVAKRRLTLAGAALLGTDQTVLDIALTFGYDSHEGFTRAFKAYMGVTPTEYRKYNLTAISQEKAKERPVMKYGENTNEILRELNSFIAKAREAAQLARKNTVAAYSPFWRMAAEKTDGLADQIQSSLARITDIAQNPDAITKHFVIIKVVEDAAVEANLLALNIGLMIARGNPEDIEAQQLICDKYRTLAEMSAIKTEKIVALFRELSALILADMRKDAALKMQRLACLSRKTAESLQGYSYIREEITDIADELSQISREEVSTRRLENLSFRLRAISLATETEVFRSPNAQAMVDQIKGLQDEFEQAFPFFSGLTCPKEDSLTENILKKPFAEIALQGGVLLFHTKGEISEEKLGKYLTDPQKEAFERIYERIESFIQLALDASDISAHLAIEDILRTVHTSMMSQADQLGPKGGVIRFLALGFNQLADAVAV